MEILAIDGGGIKGLFVSSLLERLSLDHVDFFAGTSTGGLIALALAAGYDPEDISKVYSDNGAKIFGRPRSFIGNLFKAKYRSHNLHHIVRDLFSDNLRLGNLKKRVLVPTFDLEEKEKHGRWKPKFFHNFGSDDEDLNVKVSDVAMMTSAAPTFFPSYRGFIDGGVVANNPSMCALAQALEECSLEEISMLSIGTGKEERSIPGLKNNWGFAQWSTRIVDLILSGTMDVADYQCRSLLDERYVRINPWLVMPIDLDQSSRNTLDFLEHVGGYSSLEELFEKIPAYQKS